MKRNAFVIAAVMILIAQPRTLQAQAFTGFLTGGTTKDLNDERFPTIGSGLLVEFLDGWVAGGGQLDIMFSLPYAAGRGGPLFQGSVLQTHGVRLFGLLGYFAGEDSGTNIGGGIEWRPRGQDIALRATAQDTLQRVGGFNCTGYGITRADCDLYFRGGRSWTGHEPSFHVGIAWH
jgi:hypothetical protein